MSNWTQPLCDHCWIEMYGNFDDDDCLVSFRVPTRVVSDPEKPEIEQCCKCGRFTMGGIFIRIDPDTVPYARIRDED